MELSSLEITNWYGQKKMTINQITEQDILAFDIARDLESYQRIATKSAIYPGQGTIMGISYCAHKLAGEAGEFNDHFGKAMRDDGLIDMKLHHHRYPLVARYADGLGEPVYTCITKPLTTERKDFLIKEIGDCLWYLSALCNELGISLFQAAYINLMKLKDRTDRDKLQGSGDDR